MKVTIHEENKIRCQISRIDLQKRNMKISEFAHGTKAARELFNTILEQAKTDHNFQFKSTNLMISAEPINENEIALIINEK